MKRILIGAVLSLAALSAHALTYAPYESKSIGSWPDAVAVGDVNGDGRPDVVVTTTRYFDPANDYHVHIFEGLADGSLSQVPVRVPYGATANRNGLVLTDLTGDGTAEIVVGHGQGISVVRKADFTYTNTVISGGAAADVLAVVDVDRDGASDIAALPWSGAVRLYLNDGAGQLRLGSTLPSINQGYNDLEAADLNGDGAADLVVMSGQGMGPAAAVHFHDLAGGFGTPQPITLPDGELSGGLALGDLNGDDLIDIALTGWGNSPVDLFVFLQTVEGQFAAPYRLATYDIPEPLLSTDLDRNGLSDLAVLHGGWNAYGYYLQSRQGLGTEQLWAIPYASHYSPQGFTAADFLGGDGCPDVAVADYNHGLVTLRGQDCVDANLAISAAATPTHVTVSVSNASAQHAGIDPFVRVQFKYLSRPVTISPPANCLSVAAPLGAAYDCLLSDIGAGATSALVFGVRHQKKVVYSVTGSVSSPTRDTNPADNTFNIAINR